MCLILYHPEERQATLTLEEFTNIALANGSQRERRYVQGEKTRHISLFGGYYYEYGGHYEDVPGGKIEGGPIGLMYPTGKSVKTFKRAQDGVEAVYEAYAKLAGKRPVIVHFRTHGRGDGPNTQPFVTTDKKIGFALNGSVANMDSGDYAGGDWSDAREFTKTILSIISPTAVMTSAKVTKFIKSAIRGQGVVALMRADGKVKLIDGYKDQYERAEAVWKDGLWYSHP